MSSVATASMTNNNLALAFQYTVEAYKTFQKLAEMLPNPVAAQAFANFAADERSHRDMLEARYRLTDMARMEVTLAEDLRFQDMLEGDLSHREIAETLIVRERTMERKLVEWSKSDTPADRNLFTYVAGTKRAHIAALERELAMIRLYPEWFKREDGQALLVRAENAIE